MESLLVLLNLFHNMAWYVKFLCEEKKEERKERVDEEKGAKR